MKLSLDSGGIVSIKWSKKIGNRVMTSPVIDGYGRIYVVNDNGRIYKLNSTTGDSMDSRQILGMVTSTPTISDENRIYLADMNGKVVVLDTSLKTVWKYEGAEPISANLMTIDGATYIPTLGGNLLAFYDKDLNVRDTAVRGAVTRRSGLKVMKQPKPVWGSYQGNYRHTGVQESRLLNEPVRKVTDSDVTGFPNPTNGNYKIESRIAMSKIEVIDLKGNVSVVESLTNSTQVTLDLSNLNNGLYFVKIQTKGGTIVKRVVLQR